MSAPTISLVVSTYEWPEALDAVLRALSEQSDRDFEVVIADDGSGPETADVVHDWRETFGGGIEHVRQADAGWRKSRVLNMAALATRGDYLLFADGDCLPRIGFLEAIRRAALPRWFLASKRLHMSERLSRRVVAQHLPVWRWSAFHWLVRHPHEVFAGGVRHTNRPGILVSVRDRERPWNPGPGEFAPPYESYGFLFGVSREDFERVNGFDMRFVGWGTEDVDIAIRLRRLGLRCGWPGPDATMLHLWHPSQRGAAKSNVPLRRETEQSARIEAVEGLRELAAELRA